MILKQTKVEVVGEDVRGAQEVDMARNITLSPISLIRNLRMSL